MLIALEAAEVLQIRVLAQLLQRFGIGQAQPMLDEQRAQYQPSRLGRATARLQGGVVAGGQCRPGHVLCPLDPAIARIQAAAKRRFEILGGKQLMLTRVQIRNHVQAFGIKWHEIHAHYTMKRITSYCLYCALLFLSRLYIGAVVVWMVSSRSKLPSNRGLWLLLDWGWLCRMWVPTGTGGCCLLWEASLLGELIWLSGR